MSPNPDFGVKLAGSLLWLGLFCVVTASAEAQERLPIIDMHLHAHAVASYGHPPPQVCTGDQPLLYLGLDPARPMSRSGCQLSRTYFCCS
jgi:hypothetical protein